MLGNPLLLGDDGYQISRSVRLRSSASAILSRTVGVVGSSTVFTFSAWAKIGALSTDRVFFGTGIDVNNQFSILLDSSNRLQVYAADSSIVRTLLVSNAVYRDPSAWMHIQVAYNDQSGVSSSDRVIVYVNGVRVTSFSTATYPPGNAGTYVNTTRVHYIGRSGWTALGYFDGYLTDINFIDGQALTPSAFGETDAITGVWKPRRYTGTYGTNGFFLNFSDPSAATAAAIGRDYSGNGNNWTPNNISVTAGVTYDSMLDVPTPWADGGNGRGNYAVLNPIDRIGAASPIAGNLGLAPSGNGVGVEAYSTIAIADKSYVEMTLITDPLGTGNGYLAVATRSGNVITYNHSGGLNVNGSTVSSSTYTSGDTVSIAVDAVARTATVYKNNTSVWTGSFTASGDIFFRAALYGTGLTPNPSSAVNFGQRPFAYTPPTGFRALNTQNLPEPTIVRGNRFFDATTYTGNGSSQSVVNSGAMQPDLVWVKNRATTGDHILIDAVRGANQRLFSNLTLAESLSANSVSAFNANGFSVGADANVNGTGNGLIAWQWREGATQGFDIVTYTGDGTNPRNISHGLGVTPAMVIYKARGTPTSFPAGGNWIVWHRAISQAIQTSSTFQCNTFTGATYLNATNAASTYGADNQINGSGTPFVAYLFSEVAGFSRFGSYTGNGSADGPFVFCGFRPRWVMVKLSSASGENWQIIDTARDTSNIAGLELYANLSNAESTGSGNVSRIDCLSNGFKVRTTNGGWNTNGATYIFAAFSETAFKYSLAR